MCPAGNLIFQKLSRKTHGFTLIEMVVVMLLISIIAAAVFSRSITTSQIEFVGQVDKIRNQIRYPQSMAMKRNETWGIKSQNGSYWIFSGTNPDANLRYLPGEVTGTVAVPAGITMDNFTVFFDKYGRPYDGDPGTPVAVKKDIQIDAADVDPRTFSILAETGLVK